MYSSVPSHPAWTRRLLLTALLLSFSVSPASAQRSASQLVDLSLEELMDIEVSLVSRKAERIFDTAAAVAVLTGEDLRRSGATSIPEALRLVPGVQVAHIDANKWAVSARGFTGRFAQKLLVLIDGRSVYTPLFSGVYWEAQDVLLEDVERIEVIRGPGGTLWGANAVNGIINIVTREAGNTQGGHVSAGTGSEETGFGSVRFGGRLGDRGHFRLYAKGFARDDFVDSSGAPGNDDWRMLRGGFRTDWQLSGNADLALQGDLYDGEANQTYRFASLELPYVDFTPDMSQIQGGNLLGRWQYRLAGDADLALQLYYDRTERNEALLREARDTYDADFQHRFALGDRQELLWGLGYRLTRDRTTGSFAASFDPENRSIDLFSAFLQDDLTLYEDRLRLTLGSKFEHNDHTGFEFQPSARLSWTPRPDHVVWAATSRALRIPSRADEDVRLALLILPPDSLFSGSPVTLVPGEGQGELKAEKLYALELGYRLHPAPSLLFDMTGFYNIYRDLRTAKAGIPYSEASPEPFHLVLPFYSASLMDADTYGFELSADWRIVEEKWRLRVAYAFLEIDLHIGDIIDPMWEAPEGESPEHQLTLWSALNPRPGLQFDGIIRYVDKLPSQNNDAYLVADLRLGWQPVTDLELSLVARNLLEDRHPEFQAFFVDTQPTQTQHELYGALSWNF